MTHGSTTGPARAGSASADDTAKAVTRLAEQRRKAKRTAIVHALLAAGILIAAVVSNLLGYSH